MLSFKVMLLLSFANELACQEQEESKRVAMIRTFKCATSTLQVRLFSADG